MKEVQKISPNTETPNKEQERNEDALEFDLLTDNEKVSQAVKIARTILLKSLERNVNNGITPELATGVMQVFIESYAASLTQRICQA